jgi:hypothetical protein
MVEVFTEARPDAQTIRTAILSETDQTPAKYDDGTHYATRHRLHLICSNTYLNKKE